MSYELKQSSTTRPLLFLMVLSSDHITPATGLSPTVTLSKNGAGFAAPAGALSEVGNGWYKIAPNATDNDTLGPLLLHATAGTADPSDTEFEVVTYDPDGRTTAGSGSQTVNITIKDTASNPIDGVSVWITTDVGGTNVIAGTQVSNSLGVVPSFFLNPGVYQRFAKLGGRNFQNPQQFTVV